MKADITQRKFHREDHFSRVIAQQGRVQLDSDLNEQVDIQVSHNNTSLNDVIGKCGAPKENAGFEILLIDQQQKQQNKEGTSSSFSSTESYCYKIKRGNYYVDGILCINDDNENDDDVEAFNQPDLPSLPPIENHSDSNSNNNNNNVDYPIPTEEGNFLVYLDVWERHVTQLEDPSIKEPALGDAADTTTRTKTVWQVKLHKQNSNVSEGNSLNDPSQQRRRRRTEGNDDCLCKGLSILDASGRLSATTHPKIKRDSDGGQVAGGKNSNSSDKSDNVCCDSVMSSEGGYTGITGNQLYRVEIHNPGEAGKNATFKWSKDNGTVVTKIIDIPDGDSNVLIVDSKGKDSSRSFSIKEWIEISDDRYELWGLPGHMVQITNVTNTDRGYQIAFDPGSMKVKEESATGNNNNNNENLLSITNDNFPQKFHPKIRKWDSPNGTDNVVQPKENEGYIELEKGIVVKFEDIVNNQKAKYKTGDYWLIPARTITEDIIWPQSNGYPRSLAPDGIQHHCCGLALINYCKEDDKFLSWDELGEKDEIKKVKNNELIDFIQNKLNIKFKDTTPKVEKKDDNLVIVSDQNCELVRIKLEKEKAIMTMGNKLIYVFFVEYTYPNNKKTAVCYRGRISLEKDCRKLFPALTDIKTDYDIPTTGVVNIPFSSQQMVYGRFKHFLKIDFPPAIVLGFISSDSTEKKQEGGPDESASNKESKDKEARKGQEGRKSEIISYMEDFKGAQLPFKAVNIDQEHFDISFKGSDKRDQSPSFSGKLIKLRWWAIYAKDKGEQSWTPPSQSYEKFSKNE